MYFYALNGDGDPYSSIQVQAAGPELTLGDRKLEVRSVGIANDPICYIVALDNSSEMCIRDRCLSRASAGRGASAFALRRWGWSCSSSAARER